MEKVQQRPFAIGMLACALIIGSGCNSSSNKDEPVSFEHQAIDGYIAGASVYCDEQASGSTGAAGRFGCPEGTSMMRIVGGTDVGFDETKTAGEYGFIGQLKAPGQLDYATPLSTVAVAITELNNTDGMTFTEAEGVISQALGLSNLDIDADASRVMQLIKLNSQIHTIINSFSSTTDHYIVATKALASVIEENAIYGHVINFSSGVEDVVAALNEKLKLMGPELAVDDESLATLTEIIKANNVAYEEAVSRDEIVEMAAAYSDMQSAAIEFERNRTTLSFDGLYTSPVNYTLDQFENDQIGSYGYYSTLVDSNHVKIRFNTKSMTIYETVEKARVGLGFSFEGTDAGDVRRVSVTTNDALISMKEGNPESLSIEFPEDAVFHYSSTNKYGIITEATLRVEDGRVFDAEDGKIGINIQQLRNALEKHDLDNFVYQTGNFKLTLAINGIKIRSTDDGQQFVADTYTVKTKNASVTGNGFQGYISIIYW
ncbi:MAG: hypothetical protein KDJ38_09205 [Gammaproteobacteria bacterium]|nr:hypothetical protein [Gammaproteobacteria bacterium]